MNSFSKNNSMSQFHEIFNRYIPKKIFFMKLQCEKCNRAFSVIPTKTGRENSKDIFIISDIQAAKEMNHPKDFII